MKIPAIGMRIRRVDGSLAGTALLYKPAAGMTTLGSLAAQGDLGHLARMQAVAHAARRPAALLFADLEASSSLARRLSTAGYFAVAFFLAETAGSDSAAVRACVNAARALRGTMSEVATRSGLEEKDVVLRFGLHWGPSVYVGQITTSGRSEATALGDEVNEAARIEACASGGRMLASKNLIENLAPADAAALDIDPDRVMYAALADLPTATEKARRDAPAIAVCEL